MKNSDLLTIRNLVTSFQTEGGKFSAVDQISFSIKKGETVGLVGESGCGKSVTALSLLRLVEFPVGKIEAGEIIFSGQNLLQLSENAMRNIRGNRISMIFQEPMTSLNPVFTVGEQVAEVFRIHQKLSRGKAWKKAVEMLNLVKIPAPDKRAKSYPHELSGGMRQRVMIAIALACRPELLIADEPTTALDVTIQAQILELIKNLQEELNMAVLLITHDLGVVAEFCNRVLVMYGGNIVEEATVEEIFTSPSHPYTKGLLASMPKLGRKAARLPTIEGVVPSLGNFPQGCKFQNRCLMVKDVCRVSPPKLKSLANAKSRRVACYVAHGE